LDDFSDNFDGDDDEGEHDEGHRPAASEERRDERVTVSAMPARSRFGGDRAALV
jgi:hypothetical protein